MLLLLPPAARPASAADRLVNKSKSLKILEGAGDYFLNLLNLDTSDFKIPPHHERYLAWFKALYLNSVPDKLISKNDKGAIMSVYQYIAVSKLSNYKDYTLAESGPGFVVDSKQFPIASISPEQPAAYVALLKFVAKSPRGNHYHKEKVEYMLVLSGELRCKFYLPNKRDETVEVLLHSGEMVRILPGCAHEFTAVNGDVYAMELSPQKLDLDDIFSL